MKIRPLLLLACAAAAGIVTAAAQTNPWKFTGRIVFPAADSTAARPYLCTLDPYGRLYVISSRVDDPNAHNAVYYAEPGDTIFRKFIDYTLNGDSDTLRGNIGALRGITTLGHDLVITASQPYPKTKPNTLAAAYYYTNADTTRVERFGFNINGAGYGSFINGAEMSRDSMLIAGIDFGTSFRWYNWGSRLTRVARGSWITPDSTNTSIFSNATEPGGPQTSGLDLIRDVALVPGGNYLNTSTPFYTSRNSISGTQITGGIAVWQGGVAIQPITYAPARVTDFDGFLAFLGSFPYGITLDTQGYLWVAGVDTTRRWVKGFKIEGVNALAMFDLPSSTSTDVPAPDGAPMSAPSDVALRAERAVSYVVDRYARCIWVFKNSTVDVAHRDFLPGQFELQQNYPNPFNPSTIIAYTLPAAGHVRLTVSDLLGRQVAVLTDGPRSAGRHAEVFHAGALPSGIYIAALSTPAGHASRKMLLIK